MILSGAHGTFGISLGGNCSIPKHLDRLAPYFPLVVAVPVRPKLCACSK